MSLRHESQTPVNIDYDILKNNYNLKEEEYRFDITRGTRGTHVGLHYLSATLLMWIFALSCVS